LINDQQKRHPETRVFVTGKTVRKNGRHSKIKTLKPERKGRKKEGGMTIIRKIKKA